MITISTSDGGQIYATFFLIALALAFVFFLFSGRQRQYPLSTLLVIHATVTFSLLIGSWAGTFGFGEIARFFNSSQLPASGGRTSVFALLFGWAGLVLSQKLLGVRRPVDDLYAWAIPLALIMIRMGCLFAGCCHGLPTNLPWGISYASHFPVFNYHQVLGVIAANARHSAAVHPVPLYLIISYLAVMVIAFRWRKKWKVDGSLTLFVLTLIFGFRFFIEFFRDPATNHQLGMAFWGLKKVQWLLLALTGVLTFHLIRRERKGRSQPAERQVEEIGTVGKSAYFFILLLAAVTVRSWFSATEMLILWIQLLILAVVLGGISLQRSSFSWHSLARLLPITASLLFMSQAVQKENADKEIIHTISTGYQFGQIPQHRQSLGCNGGYELYGPGYSTFGLSHVITKVDNEKERQRLIGYGVHLSPYDFYSSKEPYSYRSRTKFDGGLSIFWGMDYKDVGFKVGANLGKHAIVNGQHFDFGFLPLIYVRVGKEDKYFAKLSIADDINQGFYASFFQLGGGIGLKALKPDLKKFDFILEMGLTKLGEKNAMYVSPEFKMQRFSIQPSIRFGPETPVYGINLKYRIKDLTDGPVAYSRKQD